MSPFHPAQDVKAAIAAHYNDLSISPFHPAQDVKADAKVDEKAHKEAAKDHGSGFLGEAKAAMGHAKDAVGDKLQSKKHEGYATVRAVAEGL